MSSSSTRLLTTLKHHQTLTLTINMLDKFSQNVCSQKSREMLHLKYVILRYIYYIKVIITITLYIY